MDLIVDANVLFAALIKEGICADILFKSELHFFSPDHILTELEEHREELQEKTQRSAEEFEKVITLLRRRITLIPLEELVPYVHEASTICPDVDDIAYFCVALKIGCAIWSYDKSIKEKQDRIQIVTTSDLIRMF